ncbi:MAG TPA: homoserine dehydrogenase [Spirochaetota bacterium]|nr:homoserine dehydrogenase [Spirochaetota bacterium]HPH02627.1 homoserine dehydrogenase [Spirochaetota bacterium]HPN82793.1 homoserine dehydrogenase [Spirochaetota bacterium]
MDIRIGIAGLGTIGSGVVELVRANSTVIREKTGISLRVAAIADPAIDSRPDFDRSGIRICKDGMDLVTDPEIDIIVELVGGVAFPKKLVLAALENGKHVVTANKALLAKEGQEIYKTAAANRLALGIEASVAGGIPVIKTIRESLVGNRILEIRGIINGTCNYILTRMAEHGLGFADALAEAQSRGFAEADPTLDITGGDAAHKIAILAALAFNTPVDMADVHIEGIDRIDTNDIRYARELGYVVKLIGIARDRGAEGIEARVHPTLVPVDDQLASIRNEFNAVFLRCDFLGDGMLTGKGAGSRPTASAVVGDIVDIALAMRDHESMPPFFASERSRPVVPFGRTENRYYMHFSTVDKPGIMSRITGILGENNISIASMIQKEAGSEEAVPVVMISHTAVEENMARAIKAIDALPEVRKPTVVIRAL